jgi:hypothetical protein
MQFSVSHERDAAFASEGLRAFFEYRDLGMPADFETVTLQRSHP